MYRSGSFQVPVQVWSNVGAKHRVTESIFLPVLTECFTTQVLASLQSQWKFSLPKPLTDFVNCCSLATELRLASLLAWMRLHAPGSDKKDDHWAQWFSCLPTMDQVPLLSTASEAELQILDSYAPHMGIRARTARVQAAHMWSSAVTTAPHIWLALHNLFPGTNAPISFPLGVALMLLVCLLVSINSGVHCVP